MSDKAGNFGISRDFDWHGGVVALISVITTIRITTITTTTFVS